MFPKFNTENAAQIPTSFGGLVLMMASVTLIGLVIGASFVFWVCLMMPVAHDPALQDVATFFSPGEFRAFVTEFGFEVVTQPYVPRALLGGSRPAWIAMRALTTFWPRERWAARIDLVARKPEQGGGGLQ